MDEQNKQPLFPQNESAIPVDADKPYRASGNYILRQIAGENILVSVEENKHFGNSMLSLNETYTFLWELYQEPITLKEVLEKAHLEYEDPDGEMDKHIISFLWQGVQFGLLVEA